MKGKQIIWMCLGMGSICSALYRAPQIMQALNGKPDAAGGTPSLTNLPGGAVSGLLQAIGKNPMNAENPLAAFGDVINPQAPEEPERPQVEAPTADTLRLFSAGGDISSEQTKKILAQAAASSPVNAIATHKAPAATPEAGTKRANRPPPKVVVHRPQGD